VLGFDPASASAPFVATLVDVTGIRDLFQRREFDAGWIAALVLPVGCAGLPALILKILLHFGCKLMFPAFVFRRIVLDAFTDGDLIGVAGLIHNSVKWLRL